MTMQPLHKIGLPLLVHSYREEVPGRLRPLGRAECRDRRIANLRQVSRGDAPPCLRPTLQPREMRPPENGSLQFVEPAVVSDPLVPVLGDLSVVAPRPCFSGQRLAATQDRAAIAQSPQIFRRIEAGGRHPPDRSGRTAPVARSNGLRAILNNRAVVIFCNLLEFAEVQGVAVE